MQGRIWTLSNGLSFFRVLLVIPIAYLLYLNLPPYRFYAAILIIIAGLTDLFDGMLARKLNQVSDFGKIIDPIADKIGIGTVAVIVTMQGKLPPWFLIAVLLRDSLIFLGGLYIKKTKGVILQSNSSGKWAAAMLAFMLLITVIDVPELDFFKMLFLYGAAILMVVSFVSYTDRFVNVCSKTPFL